MVLATRCPHCETVFRVPDALLAASGGFARCGHCQQVFDARSNLLDPYAGSQRVEPATESASTLLPSAPVREPEAASETDESVLEAQTQAGARAQAENEAPAEAEVRARAEEAAARAQAQAEAHAQAQAEAEDEARAQAEAEAARAQAEAEAEARANAEAEAARAQAEAAAQAEAGDEARAQTEAEAARAQAETEAQAQAEARAEAQAEAARAQAEAETEAEAQAEAEGARAPTGSEAAEVRTEASRQAEPFLAEPAPQPELVANPQAATEAEAVQHFAPLEREPLTPDDGEPRFGAAPLARADTGPEPFAPRSAHDVHQDEKAPHLAPQLRASLHAQTEASAEPDVTADQPNVHAAGVPPLFAAPPESGVHERHFAMTREARARTPNRTLWVILGSIVSLALIVVLIAQLAWWRREAIMVYWPGSQALFAHACRELGCELTPPRDIDGLQVEASDLRQIDGPHRLELRVPLRNRYGIALAYPAIELTLFDDKNNVAIRRILAPQDYTPPGTAIAAGLPAHTTQLMIVRLDSGNAIATNFRVQIFYP